MAELFSLNVCQLLHLKELKSLLFSLKGDHSGGMSHYIIMLNNHHTIYSV